ncbi:NAD(P)-binding protein [Sistotremastrum suecicum HHB10207 ss-3]|uniref:NAD(P)-binding protein n=1 Tax=Sistotremastrum suecicum HHB10207 ss-3 TaxID=1314776 RepID=A0A165XIZ2_9AGAM|nr:NAD(P)-binding protein [Sistotremastrum suecicum HHB10207 ss-3]
MSLLQKAGQKVWFITGTSSGFGLHLVQTALSRGDKVIATARPSSLPKLTSALTSFDFSKSTNPEVKVNQENCVALGLDVTSDLESIKQVAEEAIKVWGRVDVVVNNAGFGTVGTHEESGVAGLLNQFQTNFFGPVNVTNAFLPHMRSRQSGTIVNIGSRSGWRTNIPLTGLYGSSKAALHAFTETLTTEVKSFNIRVLLVEPGAFRTSAIRTSNTHPRPADSTSNHALADSMLAPGSFSIDAYQPLHERVIQFMHSTVGKEEGDPVKGAGVIVDVVRGEGVAEGKEWPEWLFLGEDCISDVRAKIGRILKTIEQWEDVAVNTKLVEKAE